MPGSGDVTRTETGLDIEGARIDGAISQALAPKGTLTAGKSSPTGIPIPGNPFKVADVVILRKGRIREEFQVVLPDNSAKLITMIVPTAMRDTDAHYQASILTDEIRIDQNLLGLNAGLYLYVFNPLLESNTSYDLLQLIVEASNADGGKTEIANPETLPKFNDPVPVVAGQSWQFTSGSVVGGPSDPALNLIVINRLDPRAKKYDAEMAFRVYSPLDANNAAQSWQTYLGGVVSAVVDFGAGPEHIQYVITTADILTDPASPVVANRGYVDISRKKLTPGVAGTWIKNIVNLNGEKAQSNSTNIAFFTGGVNQSIQGLTLVNLVAQGTGANDPKHEKLILEYQQPSPTAVALKNVTIEMKVQGSLDSTYEVVVHKFSLKEDDWITPGQLYSAANGLGIVLRQSLKMQPGTTYVFRMTLKAINDIIYYAVLPSTLPTFTITAGTNPDIPADTAVPSGLAAISFVRVKKGGTHVRFTGTVGANGAQYYANALVIADTNAPANGVKVLRAVDSAPGAGDALTSLVTLSSAVDTLGRIEVGRKKTTVEIDKGQLVALFGLTTIYFWYYAINLIGTSTERAATYSYNLATGEASAVGSDIAVPTLATNPVTSTTGPTVNERHSKIDATCPFPSANFNTLDDYQVVLSTQNTAPAGDPTVGAEGVLVIKYGQNPTFNLSYFAALTADFYVYFRAHNEYLGGSYSVWSAGTNQHGYSRPIQDFIGTGVPTLSEGLVFNSNTSTGHTSTVLVLGSDASAVTGFYVGMAVHLPVPGTSTPQSDLWRTCTAYDGPSRQLTVDVAYTSTPLGVLAYDIHRIGVAGDRATKSGTGHGTDRIILDAGASAVDDFYKGYTIYIPGITQAGRRIRKCSSILGNTLAYNGTTKELFVDILYPAAPSGAFGYLLVNGSIGFPTAVDAAALTGIGSPVPFRQYLDGNSDKVTFEILPPSDQNAFSLTHFQIISNREGNNVLRNDSGSQAIVSGLGYSYPAPAGHSEAAAIRFRNLYRDGGSDGWSGYSYFVDLPRSVSDAGIPNYDSSVSGVPKQIDYEGISSYPDARYPNAN